MDYKKVYTAALKDDEVPLRMGQFVLVEVVTGLYFVLIRLLF